MYIYLKFCTLSCKTGIRCPPSNPTSTYKSGQVLNFIAVYNDLPKRFLSARKMHPSCNGRYWHISPVHVEKKFLQVRILFKVNNLSRGLLLTVVLMYFNFVPFGFFQLQSIDYLWIDRKTLTGPNKEFIKGTTRVENITL